MSLWKKWIHAVMGSNRLPPGTLHSKPTKYLYTLKSSHPHCWFRKAFRRTNQKKCNMQAFNKRYCFRGKMYGNALKFCTFSLPKIFFSHKYIVCRLQFTEKIYHLFPLLCDGGLLSVYDDVTIIVKQTIKKMEINSRNIFFFMALILQFVYVSCWLLWYANYLRWKVLSREQDRKEERK